MEEIKEFEELVKPIMEYLIEKHNPHTTVIITDNYAKIVTDELGTTLRKTNSEELASKSFKKVN